MKDRAEMTHRRGHLAEDAVAALFLSEGYAVLARNCSISRLGELDLVLERDGLLSIVEVKARSSMACGGPAASLTSAQIRRLRKTALHFLQAQAMLHKSVEFLAASVWLDKKGNIRTITITPFNLAW